MTTKTQHPDTIGTVTWEGKTYEIDWPFDINDETKRDPLIAVVYLDGVQLADLPAEGLGVPFTSKQQVMRIARNFIKSGGVEE